MTASETREHRLRSAHIVMDRLWRTGSKNPDFMRRLVYAYVGEKLGKAVEEAHMGSLSDDELSEVVRICRPIDGKRLRAWHAVRMSRRRAVSAHEPKAPRRTP